jgi:hypothetical protein
MSRGVVPGDVYRADAAMNERVGALGAGAGVDVETTHGRPPALPADGARMMYADLWEEQEARHVFCSLVFSYTGCGQGALMDILASMCEHAAGIGALTERQRWDSAAPGLGDLRAGDA